MNSIKVRLERLIDWLARIAPDVLCLQEIKLVTGDFPFEQLAAAGYEAVAFGQKTYNGVAILSRAPLTNIVRGFDPADPDARLIAATTAEGIRIISAYMPNGGGEPERFDAKLAWMRALLSHLRAHHTPDEPLALCGDFNIAPFDDDVFSMQMFGGTPHVHPESRAALRELEQWGLVDVVRPHHPQGGLFTWWDYRMLGFPKNHGMRIDHIYATRTLASRCSAAWVDRQERKGKLPSDHAPVLARFD